ncbi:hypothetical protein ACTA71_012144 [Dictyostelium dimigraforme]
MFNNNLIKSAGIVNSGNVAIQNIKFTPLICNSCKNVFPNAASELLDEHPGMIIDKRYTFTCANCSDKKVNTLNHLPKPWKTLHSFISDNSNTLLLGGKTINYLNKNLSGVLSSYRNLFCSSCRNMWGNVSQYQESDPKNKSSCLMHDPDDDD